MGVAIRSALVAGCDTEGRVPDWCGEKYLPWVAPVPWTYTAIGAALGIAFFLIAVREEPAPRSEPPPVG